MVRPTLTIMQHFLNIDSFVNIEDNFNYVVCNTNIKPIYEDFSDNTTLEIDEKSMQESCNVIDFYHPKDAYFNSFVYSKESSDNDRIQEIYENFQKMLCIGLID